MITKEQAIHLGQHGGILHHVSKLNRDGTPVRCRVNGRCKVFHTRPADFQLPVKYGLKTCFYVNLINQCDWVVAD